MILSDVFSLHIVLKCLYRVALESSFKQFVFWTLSMSLCNNNCVCFLLKKSIKKNCINFGQMRYLTAIFLLHLLVPVDNEVLIYASFLVLLFFCNQNIGSCVHVSYVMLLVFKSFYLFWLINVIQVIKN